MPKTSRRPSKTHSKAIEKTKTTTPLTKEEQEAIKEWVNTLNLDPILAKEIIESPERHAKYRDLVKNKLDVDLWELIDMTQEAYKDKVNSGSGGQAQKMAMALGILRTKAFGPDDKPIGLNIGGKNVQINLGWQFGAYGKKK